MTTPSPRIEVLVDADSVGGRAAELVVEVVRARPAAVLGVATGSTPGPLYRDLVAQVRSGAVDLSAVTVFLLDEYVGLPHEHPGSYHATIRRELTDLVGIPDGRVHGPDVHGDLAGSCAEYEDMIDAAGGVDLQILGIGRNGHVAFNEPGTSFDAQTHVATLTETTRRDNSRFFESLDAVPTLALTQGPATLLRARRLVLLAAGEAKAPAIAAALRGSIDESCPASIVRRHPDAWVLLDRAAASLVHR